jgi:murein DD-endopeptidase MepM/ murein hydrolase activator NlpD
MIAAAILAAALTVTPAARSMQPGELVVLTIESAALIKDVRVIAFGAETRAFPIDNVDMPRAALARRWQALIGIDLDTAPGKYTVRVRASAVAIDTAAPNLPDGVIELVVKPKKFPTRRLSVNEAFVNPPKEAQARIAAESREQQAIWDAPAATRLWSSPFVRPVAARANSAFGTRSVFNGQSRNPHGGADFLSPAGTPVKAPNAGRVALAKSLYYSGNTVIIDHGLGVFSFLCHLSKINVAAGDVIAAGQIVGLVGATGRVTGPHLHWSLRVSGARVDPLALLALLGK